MPMIAPDLVRRLKRLRLGGLLPTLPDRAIAARQGNLSPLEFLELCLQDEIDRLEKMVKSMSPEQIILVSHVTALSSHQPIKT
mgnify:CR=1 FL=1